MSCYEKILKEKKGGLSKLAFLHYNANILLRRVCDEDTLKEFEPLARNGINIDLGRYHRRGKGMINKFSFV